MEIMTEPSPMHSNWRKFIVPSRQDVYAESFDYFIEGEGLKKDIKKAGITDFKLVSCKGLFIIHCPNEETAHQIIESIPDYESRCDNASLLMVG